MSSSGACGGGLGRNDEFLTTKKELHLRFRKSTAFHRVIRHFESSRSNEVAEGRLPTYAFARQYSNQLSYSDISYVSFSIDMKNQRND